jgi:hypothetical protein
LGLAIAELHEGGKREVCAGEVGNSFHKTDRNFQSKSGKTFPDKPVYPRFGPAIAEALKAEFKGSTSAVKAVVNLTGANERTVRNWLEGKNGPGGDNLIALLRHSDTVLRTVLDLSGRGDLAVQIDLRAVRSKLKPLLQTMRDLHGD